jgi:flagellar biosynthesis/type III secretory pathway M-ring protein FliF/YscJ
MTVLAAPALPLHTAGKYVAAAYIVFVVMLVVYLGIMSIRTRRTQRQLSELHREVAERQTRDELDRPELAGRAPGREGTASPEREPAV